MATAFQEEFVEAVIAERSARGLSQAELSRRIGDKSGSMVGNIESRRQGVGPALVQKLSEALGLRVEVKRPPRRKRSTVTR